MLTVDMETILIEVVLDAMGVLVVVGDLVVILNHKFVQINIMVEHTDREATKEVCITQVKIKTAGMEQEITVVIITQMDTRKMCAAILIDS